MVEYGAKRFDFPATVHLTPGENRTLEITVTDELGVDIGSFAGWEFEFFVMLNNTANGIAALQAEAIADIVDADISPISAAPVCRVPFIPSTLPASPVRTYWYELWRVDAGNVIRLSYGDLPVEA